MIKGATYDMAPEQFRIAAFHQAFVTIKTAVPQPSPATLADTLKFLYRGIKHSHRLTIKLRWRVSEHLCKSLVTALNDAIVQYAQAHGRKIKRQAQVICAE